MAEVDSDFDPGTEEGSDNLDRNYIMMMKMRLASKRR